ncbi:MAG: carboxylate--amine ligase [Acidobacteria bacterium]|nr:MAG: carboxylate--amine ligase [Acidobacteriota bacterium]
MNPSIRDRRLLVLCTTTGYQTRAFVEAAKKIGLSVIFGTDRCRILEDPWRDGALPLRFENPEESARRIVDYARSSPVDAIVALGDRPTPTAARACRALKLHYHPPEAADACRDKSLFRERLSAARVNAPSFLRFHIDADPRELLPLVSERVGFPCVLKPLALSASRGVIRADDADQFIGAFGRIEQLLRSPEVRVMREDTSDFIQAEAYVEGDEVAVEGLMERGELRVLAIFDKPEPLVGPFFEETIYVTPSRLKPEIQSQVVETLGRAARALGLHHGPLHAEVRINSDGVWVLEVAARPIGGLCSRALRFSLAGVSGDLSLEELLIRLALGEDVRKARREEPASGVMMIPIPAAGAFQGVEGVEEARRIPGVEEIHITVKPNEKLVPLPEGASYLGFIFARGPSPGFVEEALRAAHRKMKFTVGPELPVI